MSLNNNLNWVSKQAVDICWTITILRNTQKLYPWGMQDFGIIKQFWFSFHKTIFLSSNAFNGCKLKGNHSLPPWFMNLTAFWKEKLYAIVFFMDMIKQFYLSSSFLFFCVCVCVCDNLFWKIYLRLCIINSNQSIKIWGVLIYLFISSQRVRWNYFKKIRFQGGKISRMSIAVPLPKGTGYAINNEVCKHVFSRFQKFTTN